MPKLSDSMEVGRIVEWRVSEGDQVKEGDVLAEIESDKAVMELECFRDGVVSEILYGDDEEVPVGEPIARIAEEGAGAAEEEPSEEAEGEEEAPPEEEESAKEVEQEEATEEAEPSEEKKTAEEEAAEEAEPSGEEETAEEEPSEEEEAEQEPEEKGEAEEAPEPAEAEKKEAPQRDEERVAISPYARKLAEEKGIDYRQIEGSGPGGRIVADDIKTAAEGAKKEEGEEPEAEAVEEEEESAAEEPETKREKAPARPAADEELPALELEEGEAEVVDAPFRLKTQARRVMASQHVIPHFYVTRGVDVSDLLERKDRLKEETGATLTHVIMLACLRALREHPEVNRTYDRGKIIKWNDVNMGLAVDTDQGLTVAVLAEAQDLTLAEIVEKVGPLVEKARQGKLSARERRHPTFTITNLGMLDVEHFEPIINPPSSVTLAVASALPAVLAKGESMRVGMIMKLTAACDHRIVDGATAARFLHTVRELLESPDDLLS